MPDLCSSLTNQRICKTDLENKLKDILDNSERNRLVGTAKREQTEGIQTDPYGRLTLRLSKKPGALWSHSETPKGNSS